MKKILFLAAVAALTLTGCYEKFDAPKPFTRYADEDFGGEAFPDYELKTIADVKALFSDPGNELQYLVPNAAFLEKYPDFVQKDPVSGGDPKSSTRYSYYYPISEMWAIKGKVITNDAFGNFFRGLYIQDDTGAIEIKVGDNGMYTKYSPGTTVYILCDGLVLGNYRSMLSLGLQPMSDDMSDNGTPYPNRFMEVPTIIDRHVKLGEEGTITEDDITVIGASQTVTADQLYDLCGRLVRFEGLESVWEDYVDQYDAGYPQVFYKLGFNTYTTFNFQDLIDEWRAYRDGAGPKPVYDANHDKPEPENLYLPGDRRDYPSWGFKQHDAQRNEEDQELVETQDNYASAKFVNPNFNLGVDGYGEDTELLVRTSGYSRFALDPVLPGGAKATITGIVQRYTDGRGNNIAFQIAVNNVSDIVEE